MFECYFERHEESTYRRLVQPRCGVDRLGCGLPELEGGSPGLPAMCVCEAISKQKKFKIWCKATHRHSLNLLP